MQRQALQLSHHFDSHDPDTNRDIITVDLCHLVRIN